MDVKLLLLINCAALVYCQNTTDPRPDGESWANKFFKALRHEMKSTRHLLSSQQKTDVLHDRQIMTEMKSEIQDIRRLVSDQNQLVENIRNRLDEIDMKSELQSIRRLLMSLKQSPVRGESHTRRRLLKSTVDEIREVVAEQHNGSRNDSGNECPPGFDYASDVGSCYKAIFERMTWDAATERCRQQMPGSHLATITSRAENNAIARYLQSKVRGNINKCTRVDDTPWPQAKDLIWIGAQTKNPLSCQTPYVWKPLEGVEIPLNYFNWVPDNPDCYGAGENCIQMATGINYKWNDCNCTRLSCALCELPVHL